LNDIFNSSSNIGFILNSNEFKKDPSVNLVLRVNERGAGWTKSCGSGAASAAAFMIKHVSDEQHNGFMAKVEQEGGILSVKWNPTLEKNDSHKPLYLSGPSKLEYVGKWSA
jgi:diaminopimelate epimerase